MKKQLKFAIGLLAVFVSCSTIAQYRYIKTLNFDTGIKSGEDNSSGGNEGVWTSITPSYTPWVISGEPKNCQTWLPDMFSDSVQKGTTIQSSNDCSIEKTRTKQNMEKNSATGEVRSAGESETEKQIFNDGQHTRTLEVFFKQWATTGSPENFICDSWLPTTDTIYDGTLFGQTGTNCNNVEQTLRVRGSIDGVAGIYMGTPVVRSGVNTTRMAIGTKTHEWGQGIIMANSTYITNNSLSDPASGAAINYIFNGSGKIKILKSGPYKLSLELIDYKGENATTKVTGKPYFKYNDCENTEWSCNIEIDAPIQVLEGGTWKSTTVYTLDTFDETSHFVLNYKRTSENSINSGQ